MALDGNGLVYSRDLHSLPVLVLLVVYLYHKHPPPPPCVWGWGGIVALCAR